MKFLEIMLYVGILLCVLFGLFLLGLLVYIVITVILPLITT